MDIQVISLRDSSLRRANIATQFAAADVQYEFFDAMTPRHAPAHVDGYNESEFLLNCGRGATDAEIACYASHLELWRRCATGNRPYLILEDDARLTRSFCDGLKVLDHWVVEFGLVRAALPLPRHSARVVRHDGFALH